MADGAELLSTDLLSPILKAVSLPYLCGSARFKELDKLDAYYRCKQYESRRYDWDGNMRGYAQAADIAPGWFVPLSQRKPSSRYDLARLIVRRLTAMVFGSERFPKLVVEGDDDAQDYVRALSEAAKLPARMQEVRDKGGAQGAVGVSLGFVDGLPRISPHSAKHITILRWADRYEHRPAEVLESYSYSRTVWDPKSGRPKEVTMYYARYWNENFEVIWDPIPDAIAREGGWQTKVKRTTIRHDYGFCPFYWAQNIPESEEVDGDSDFEGMCDTFDDINTLRSATNKGTVANVIPTLLVKDDPRQNDGVVRKGEGQAIYSKGGAEYLELKGDSLKAGLEQQREMKKETLDTVGVVLGDPDKMSSGVQSAAALRMLYLPMLTCSDILRGQYGTLIVQIMTGMLQAAKLIQGRKPGEIKTTVDGQMLQERATVSLPDRVVKVPGKTPPPGDTGDPEDGTVTTEPRVPGESENITLNWPPYFPNTWTDTKMAVDAVQGARGGGSAVISRRTAVENLSGMMGIVDPEAELAEIEKDRAFDAAFMQVNLKAETEITGGVEEEEPFGPGGRPPGKKKIPPSEK